MPDDDGDLDAEDRAADRAKSVARANDDAIRETMKTKSGRRAMWRALELSSFKRNPYVEGDPHATAFQCGEMSVGQSLWNELVRCASIDLVRLMEREADDISDEANTI